MKGRSFVKSVIRQCHLCRRHEGKPYSAPQRRIQQFKKGGSFTKVLDKRVEKLKVTTPTFAKLALATRSSTIKNCFTACALK